MSFASVPAFTRTLRAPYHGVVTPSNAISVSGCSKARIVAPPQFDLRAGVGGFSDFASAKTCGQSAASFGGQGYGYSDSEFDLTLKIPGKHNLNSTTQVVANWVLSYVAVTRFSVGGCAVNLSASGSYCDSYAGFSLYAFGYVLDRSTGNLTPGVSSWNGFGNSSYNDTYCNSGSCTSGGSVSPGTVAGSVSAAWTFNVTNMVKSDAYVLEMYVYGDTSAGATFYNAVLGPTSVSASLNFDTVGNGAQLISITET
jgi:hypothetical protein